ncbi:MAG TPA: outer membrane beta-barrel protein [Acidobacteriota bacterium]|nr:outer membrane beta-barrel protein [Acidobacteriota bacterium]
MSLRTLVAAAAVAAFFTAAPQAPASTLDYQGLAFSGANASALGGSQGSSLSALNGEWKSGAGPVRRRSPRYDGYGPRPRTFATIGLGSFDPSDQPGSGLYVNGTIGTELPSAPIDVGLQLSWYHRSTGGSQFITTFEDPAGNVGQRVIETDEIQTDLVPLMAFLRVRFPMGDGLEPYVGAGAGWEWLSVEGVDSDGFSFSDDYDGFGAQFLGGMNFNVAPNTALYGEVLYNMSTVSAEFYDPFFGVNVRDEIEMDGAGIHGGLRFRF